MGTHRDVILVGASSGGLGALSTLLGGLPARVEAIIAITQHRHPTSRAGLRDLLARHCPLPVIEPQRSGEVLRLGRVYLAPADRHLIIRPGAVWLDGGP